MAQLDRITRNPTVMGGKPCIRGMRVTVGMIVGQIGAGHTIEELLADSSSAALRRVACPRARSYSASRMKLLVDMNLSPRWIPLSSWTRAVRQFTGPLSARRMPPIRKSWHSQPQTIMSS
jgi:Protein of unknown function (DUF433)